MEIAMRSGIKVLEDIVGDGEEIQRHQFYRMSLRIWLNKGEPVKWTQPFGLLDQKQISDDGQTLTADYRIDREFLFGGLFYGIEGMRIGGKRLLKISPHLAYRDKGVENMIPPNAVLKIEVTIHGERKMQ
jgi:hypothetical protein